MPYIIALLGLIGGAAFWWYRLRVVKDAASEAVDAAGRIRGAYRRHRIRTKNEMAPLTAIDDPITAAATVILSIVSEDDPAGEVRVEALSSELARVSDAGRAEEALIYARWAIGEVVQTTTVIDKISPFLRTALNDAEKADLLAMLDRVAGTGAMPVQYRDRVSRLRVKLGMRGD